MPFKPEAGSEFLDLIRGLPSVPGIARPGAFGLNQQIVEMEIHLEVG